MSEPSGDQAPFTFETRASAAAEDQPRLPAFKVLSVDDDPAFQDTLAFALRDFHIEGRSIELLRARSAEQAALTLATHTDIAVVLLDVVMETDDAGLRLVRGIREQLNNAEVRIVLLTGQPGFAPMRPTMGELDINEYWLKHELSAERLFNVMTSNLRSWQQLQMLTRARRGLHLIIEAGEDMVLARSQRDFCDRMLYRLALLLETLPSGVVCVRRDAAANAAMQILAAQGQFVGMQDGEFTQLQVPEHRQLLQDCLDQQQDQFAAHAVVLYIPNNQGSAACAVLLQTETLPTPTEREMLRVFGSHASAGWRNVTLMDQLERMAFSDSLLPLHNRNSLMRLLWRVRNGMASPPYSLMLVDIDEFSTVNLALGTEHGNGTLREVGQLLSKQFPEPMLVARLHDDVFAVLGHSCDFSADALQALRGADRELNLSMVLAELNLAQGTPQDIITMMTLMLRDAKRRGYRQLVIYDPRQHELAIERSATALALAHALRIDQIKIVLQPQVELSTGRIIGAEALARWQRPDGSHVPPDQFIPIAEANGDIVALGLRVFRLTAEVASQVRQLGGAGVRLAVNLSGMQVARGHLAQDLLQVCAETGVSPQELELEITESTAMQGVDSDSALAQLREAGFRIAIDDFGTGYSSLSRLRTLPIDMVKIDRSFIHEIGQVDNDAAVADMIIRLAHRLQLEVLAEGIETPAQLEWLAKRKCHLGQGYLFHRPMPPEQLLALLALQARSDG